MEADSSASAPSSAATPASPAPSPSPTRLVHQLGDSVSRPSGGSVTAHDYRIVTDVADHSVGAIDIEVCVGHEDAPEGVYVTTEFWSAVSEDHRRYGSASTTWRHEEISPVLDVETDVASGDCLRGWVVTEASTESDISKIRYFNSYSEEPNEEEVIWEIPED